MIVNAKWLSLLTVIVALAACGRQTDPPAAGKAPEAAIRAADCLQLEQGWVRAPMPGHAMTAAYGRLANRCDHAVPLAWLHSDQATKVELHRTEIVDGVSRMRAEEQPQVPAGGVLELAPGGLHLMLHGVGDNVVDGAELTLSLGTAADDALDVTLSVRGAAAQGQTGSQAGHPNDASH